jgi:branched-chain amino acid transport system ATP-binding protein
MLFVKNLDVYYGKTEAVRDVSFRIEHGQVVALLGSNGAGKTTIISAINGYVSPAAGEIIYKGKSIVKKRPHQIVKAGIAQVSQEKDLFPELTVMENLRLGGVLQVEKRRVLKIMEEIFEHFPRLGERKWQKAGTLSGGEQQMLVIGRAMMSNPELFLLDEPTTGLAPVFVKRIAELLENLKKSGITMLLVEQNAPVAVSLASYFYVLRSGRIVTEGNTDSLPVNLNEYFARYYM